MNSLGEYLRVKREQLEFALQKVAAQLDIDTSILSMFERNERPATKEKLAIIQIEFERLYDISYPGCNAIETLDSIEEIRIIKGTLK